MVSFIRIYKLLLIYKNQYKNKNHIYKLQRWMKSDDYNWMNDIEWNRMDRNGWMELDEWNQTSAGDRQPLSHLFWTKVCCITKRGVVFVQTLMTGLECFGTIFFRIFLCACVEDLI